MRSTYAFAPVSTTGPCAMTRRSKSQDRTRAAHARASVRRVIARMSRGTPPSSPMPPTRTAAFTSALRRGSCDWMMSSTSNVRDAGWKNVVSSNPYPG